MFHSLESTRRDDFNECHIIGFGWEMRKLSWNSFVHYFLTVALLTIDLLLSKHAKNLSIVIICFLVLLQLEVVATDRVGLGLDSLQSAFITVRVLRNKFAPRFSSPYREIPLDADQSSGVIWRFTVQDDDTETVVCIVKFWPASRQKGPLDISHSVDQDQLLYDVGNIIILFT